MKNIVITIIFFLTNSSANFSQWYQQNSGTTNSLFQVQFVNQQVGWTNSGPELYKTTDGGENWQSIYSNNDGIFQFLFFDENFGWALIAYNPFPELLKSTDGGVTWSESYAVSYDYIRDFEFINPDTGWIVGERTISPNKNSYSDNAEFPVLFKETTDGGTTWMEKSFSPDYPFGLIQLEAISYENLIIAGWDTLFKTTNAGTSWQKYPLPQGGNYLIQFINLSIGWVSTGGKLFKTTDGGYNWYQQANPITSYYFTTTQIGWYTYNNQIYQSTNGGNSWTAQNSNTTYSLYEICFVDNNNGWAVGQNGTIIYTPNGGVPVELISFTTDVVNSNVHLNWTTATETNNQGFEILRLAQNDNVWNKLGFVPGHGTTTEPQFYSLTDEAVEPGTYQYRLKQIDFDGSFEFSETVEVIVEGPTEFSLSQNYPNPFNPMTKIKYTIPTPPVSSPLVNGRTKDGFVSLKVYDVIGNEVVTLVNEEKPAGEYEVEFNGTDLPSGIYFYQLLVSALQSKDGRADLFVQTKKMVLLK